MQSTVYSKAAIRLQRSFTNSKNTIQRISRAKPSSVYLTTKILILILLFSHSSSYICDTNCARNGCDELTGQCTSCDEPYYMKSEPILARNTCVLCQLRCTKCSIIDGYKPYCLECFNGVKPIDGYCPDCSGVGVCVACLQNKFWFDVVSKKCIKDTSYTNCAVLGLDSAYNPVCVRCKDYYYPK